MIKLIGLLGFIGSGKNTVAQHLVKKYNFQSIAFADVLKDTISILFDWPRDCLEGIEPEHRAWREHPDPFWSEKLGKPIVPRQILQYFGTDMIRSHLHYDFWVIRLEKKLQSIQQNVVVSDCRFPNECGLIRRLGGEIWQVSRGEEPVWWHEAQTVIHNEWPLSIERINQLERKFGAHSSEWLWANETPSRVIQNSGTLDQLLYTIDEQIKILF